MKPILDRIVATLFTKKTMNRKCSAAKLAGLPLALALALLLAAPADATDFYWIGGTDDWNVAANWDQAGVPNLTDSVYINNGGTALIEGGVTGTANYLFVGNAGNGTLEISNGGSVTTNDIVIIGYDTGSTGTVTVSGPGSTLNVGSVLYVGEYGANGTLEITDGGSVTTVNEVSIGGALGSTGTITVDGENSTLEVGNYIFVGDAGDGTLNITNGGSVTTDSVTTDDYISIGGRTGSNGTVTVDGAGSTLDVGGYLNVGREGTGTLEIAGGGSVTAGLDVYIGSLAGSDGEVTVDGPGSTLGVGTSLYVGRSSTGTGTLEITNGGSVTTVTDVVIGDDANAIGKVTVGGEDSTLSSGDNLYVGQYGTGTLNIENGGTAEASRIYIGSLAGSIGTVTVDGSTLDVGTSLYVGDSGNGTLNIEGDGKAEATYIYIGNAAGSIGKVTVDGSTLDVDSYLYVGYNGNGTLDIKDGGNVTTARGGVRADGNVNIGFNAGSTSEVNVSGSNSTLDVGTSLYVGQNGNGTLNITDGGSVTTGATPDTEMGDGAYIAFKAGSIGKVTVDGENSTLSAGGSLYVTYDNSTGTLEITNGGSATANEDVFIGAWGTGTVTVDGTDTQGNASTLSATAYLRVGYRGGTGTLNITNGGTATADSIRIGDEGTGTLTVSNTGTLGNGNYAGNISNNGTLTFDQSVDQTLSGAITGTGGLTKTGTGTLILPRPSARARCKFRGARSTAHSSARARSPSTSQTPTPISTSAQTSAATFRARS